MDTFSRCGKALAPLAFPSVIALLALLIVGPPAVMAYVAEDVIDIGYETAFLFGCIAWTAAIGSIFIGLWISDTIQRRRSEREYAAFIELLSHRDDGKTLIDLRSREVEGPTFSKSRTEHGLSLPGRRPEAASGTSGARG